MKYIKLFEDLLTPLNTNSIKGLLVELEDNGFDIKYKNTCMWPTNTLPGLFSNATDWDWEEVNGYIIKISKESRQLINVGSDEELKIIDAANIVASALGENNITWITKPGLIGSAKSRRPDITQLKRLLPTFSPKTFKEVLTTIKV